jgi:hypothetical protein
LKDDRVLADAGDDHAGSNGRGKMIDPAAQFVDRCHLDPSAEMALIACRRHRQ